VPRIEEASAVYADGVLANRVMCNGTQVWPPASAPVTGAYDALYPKDWKPVSNKTFLETPANIALPDKYTSITSPSLRDPTFKTAMFRATAVSDQPSSGTSRYRHEYSRRTPFNSDNSRYIVLNGSARFFCHTTADGVRINGGRTDGSVGTSTIAPQDPCDWTWHPTDPNKIIFSVQGGGLTFYEFDVVTHTLTTKFDLSGRLTALHPDYANVNATTMGGEGRPSRDGRYWGFKLFNRSTGTNYGLLTYDMQTDTIVGHVRTNTNPNNVTMSGLGNYIIASRHHLESEGVSYADCEASSNLNYLGTQAWTRDFTSRKTMHVSSEHADPGIDVNGREVYVTSNYYATTLAGVDSGWVFMRDCQTGEATLLVRNWEGNLFNQHVSTCMNRDRPGWCVWSTYHDSRRGETAWKDGVVTLVELKANPRVLRIAHHRVVRTTYWQEPHATISPDGLLVMFSSTWQSDDMDTTANTIPLSYFVALPSWIYD
jgi:hypothetical protein